MDGPLLEHSDSDSGESWTLLEPNIAFADEAPDFAEAPNESPEPETHEKDEDTDGISIISDSDHEPHTPYQQTPQEIRPIEQANREYVPVDAHISNLNGESLTPENDFLGDNNKHKIYVHRRNKRLSTVLNIIVLGSVITAAGVAIGHMWGAKNDCVIQNTPTVNKILSNLYKLQEENAYLRNKLKELSQYHQLQQKLPMKQPRCKKVFEEPLSNKNVNKHTKCVDDIEIKSNKLDNHFHQPVYEKEFVEDIKQLEKVYEDNKSWLDDEINKRLKDEKESWNSNISQYVKSDLNEKSDDQKDNHQNKESSNIVSNKSDLDSKEPFIKISYADSLKTDHTKKIIKRDNQKMYDNGTSKYKQKKKAKGDNENVYISAGSDDDLKKDDRYSRYKIKQDKKKYNHHKSFIKQKRRNKYEQWEMKGGLIKDYDDLSFSSQDDVKQEQKTTSVGTKSDNISDQYMDVKKTEKKGKDKEKRDGKKQETWYQKRAELREEARQKLEQELFGNMAPNSARWYFKRMQKREQCRTKGNSTNRKVMGKRDMNYKVKH